MPEVGPKVLHRLLMDGGGDRAWRRGMGDTGRDKNKLGLSMCGQEGRC